MKGYRKKWEVVIRECRGCHHYLTIYSRGPVTSVTHGDIQQTPNTAGLVTIAIKAITVVIAGSGFWGRMVFGWVLTILGKKVSAEPHFPFAYSCK